MEQIKVRDRLEKLGKGKGKACKSYQILDHGKGQTQVS